MSFGGLEVVMMMMLGCRVGRRRRWCIWMACGRAR